MSVAAGPNLVNTGLVLHIDPANPACFTPGGTTCKNLITDGLVTGASGSPGAGTHIPNPLNFPTYSEIHGGVFNFAGGRGMNCEEDLGKNTELTLIIWFYKIGLGSEYLTDARADGGQWFLTNYTSRNITYTNAVSYNFTGTYADAPTGFLNTWHMVAVTAVAGATGKIYLNGAEVSPYFDQTVMNPVLGKNFRIGTRFTGSSPWTGYMGPVVAYNRVLTAQEISQNYQAIRGRYPAPAIVEETILTVNDWEVGFSVNQYIVQISCPNNTGIEYTTLSTLPAGTTLILRGNPVGDITVVSPNTPTTLSMLNRVTFTAVTGYTGVNRIGTQIVLP